MTDTIPDPRIDNAAGIARQNDAFRRHVCLNAPYPDGMPALEGRLVVTAALQGEGLSFALDCMWWIGRVEQFGEENDPEGHHDFGAVEVRGRKVFWKIDAYDSDYAYGSEDPSDPAQTARVLTIMFPSDW